MKLTSLSFQPGKKFFHAQFLSGRYVTGHYFVDIHPPLAKLIMATVIWASGYEPLNDRDVKWWTENGFVGTMDYENIYKT